MLARAIRPEREIKGIWIKREKVKLSLFADDMILYIEDPQKLHQEASKPNKKIQQHSWIQSQHSKVNSIPVHNSKLSEKEIREATHFTVAYKQMN